MMLSLNYGLCGGGCRMNIFKDWNKDQKEFKREYKKEMKEVLTGTKKGMVLLNKYGEECWGIPCYIKKVYGFDIKRGDIKVKEISTEQFKKLYQIAQRKKRLENQKRKLIKDLLK